MAVHRFQGHDPRTGAFNGADVATCRVVVPFAHKLVSAVVFAHHVVTTGTVNITLRKCDPNEARSGSQVGEKLENDDLGDHTSIAKKYPFVLSPEDQGAGPAWREYLVNLNGSDAADRFDDPMLYVEVDDKIT